LKQCRERLRVGPGILDKLEPVRPHRVFPKIAPRRLHRTHRNLRSRPAMPMMWSCRCRSPRRAAIRDLCSGPGRATEQKGPGRSKRMAEAIISATESALENQRIGGLQIRVAALCALIQICDGYDVNSIGVSVPSLTHAWNLPGPAFTQAFLWSS